MGDGAGEDRGEELMGAQLCLEHVAAGEGPGGDDIADGEIGARAGRRVDCRHCGEVVGLSLCCR